MLTLQDILTHPDHRATRHFLLAGCGMLVIALGSVHLLAQFAADRPALRLAQPLPPPAPSNNEGRITTITRSVLDDGVLTGSIGRVTIDPCAVEQRPRPR